MCSLPKRNSSRMGLSMIEVLIVIAILALFIVMSIQLMAPNLLKSYDGRRKSDLAKIKIAFEEYFNDKECYPPTDILESCGGQDLRPYLGSIPCDPQSQEPYLYLPEGDVCPIGGFRVLTELAKTDDPQIRELNCDGAMGCGAGVGLEAYNYGVSVGVPVSRLASGAQEVDHSTDTICCVGAERVCNVIPMGGACPGNLSYQTYEACRAAGCQ